MDEFVLVLTSLALTATISASTAVSMFAATAQPGASIAGTAHVATGQVATNITVQLRDLATGQLAGTTTSSATGTFGFAGIAAGNYSIELVNAARQIIGASASIPVTAGAALTGISVTASAVGAIAAGAAAGAAGATGAGIST